MQFNHDNHLAMNLMQPIEATEWMESVMEREGGSHCMVLGGEANL
jgi:hypothetical protein